MHWITNHPRTHKGMWPRRENVNYIDGPPKATDDYSVEDFENMRIVGVYVDISLEEYKNHELIWKPKKKSIN